MLTLAIHQRMSTEQTRWLLKVLQPERSLASFPGAAGLSQEIHAALLGLPLETYSGELFRLRAEAKQAAASCSTNQASLRCWLTFRYAKPP